MNEKPESEAKNKLTAHLHPLKFVASIEAGDLSKRFNREWIFKNLSYKFESGRTFAITGPNGSGKSTLLQVLWGQLPQTSGQLQFYRGENQIRVEDIYQHIALAAPYVDLVEELTLQELLSFHFQLRRIRNQHSIDDLIKILYLENARNKFVGNFSSGMKQRVRLALAFYTQADIIFLDEPGSNLDRQAFDWYLDHLNKLPADTLTFIASNNPEEYPKNAVIMDMMALKGQSGRQV